MEEQASNLQVIRFSDRPFSGISTYVSLGLSNTPLVMSDGRAVRQEILFSSDAKYSENEIASFMLTFCEFILSARRPLLRGDVVGPTAPIVTGTGKNAVYATIPTIFPDQFRTFSQTDPATVFVWLIALAPSEVEYVKNQGWSRFEDKLEEENPDLTDLKRESII